MLTPKPRLCPPCPLECFALDVGQRSGISRGRGEAGTSETDPCPCCCWRWVRARGKGGYRAWRGSNLPLRVYAANSGTAPALPVGLGCGLWPVGACACCRVGAGAGLLALLASIGLQPRHGLFAGLGYPCLGQHPIAPSCPVLVPCWASMLALGCWAGLLALVVLVVLGWVAGAGRAGRAGLGCWCWVCWRWVYRSPQGRRGTPQSLRGERG